MLLEEFVSILLICAVSSPLMTKWPKVKHSSTQETEKRRDEGTDRVGSHQPETAATEKEESLRRRVVGNLREERTMSRSELEDSQSLIEEIAGQ